MLHPIVIAAYARSPFTPAGKGALASVRPDELAARVVAALVERSGIPAADIEDLIVGCAFPEGEQGLNVARLIGLRAGLPDSVAGVTVNRFCGSSMQAIHMAAGAIRMDAGEAFLCAGVESMSRVPMMGFNPMPHPGLMESCPQAFMSMGETAEIIATRWEVSRREQDVFAFDSQRKADRAQATGRFDDEIVPIGDVSRDGCIRADAKLDKLATLGPAFVEGGSVTAGNASPLTDGAAAVLVCRADYADRRGLQPLARIRSIAVAGCAPEVMGIGPVAASLKALCRAGLSAAELDVIEINEAFAAQAIAVIRELGVRPMRVNLDGGAIALGHPLGASGARITGKAAQLLRRVGGRYALATQCIGGGQGIATVLEAL